MDQYQRHLDATQSILDEKFKKGQIHNQYVGEILEGLSEISVFKERVAALQANSERSLNTILQVTFQNDRPRLSGKDIEAIKFVPAPVEDDIAISPMNLYGVAKRLYLFFREDLNTEQMKKAAFEILSNLHPSEIPLFKGIFAGNLPVKNITKNLVETAFPDLFAGEEKVEEKPAPKAKDKPKAPVMKDGKKVVGKPMKTASELAKDEATTEDIEEVE